MQPTFLIENSFDKKLICGIDEAGRGPLAGPVVACCILLNRCQNFSEINDSKKLSKIKRQKLFDELIKLHQFGIGIADEKEIDDINILEATKLAMYRAYKNFYEKSKIIPQAILVDGNFRPFETEDLIEKEDPKMNKIITIKPVVKGDQISLSIASASIIAKEYRDKIMENYHELYPNYGFNKNYGYGTKLHLEAIKKFGISPIHRLSFEPIKSIIKFNRDVSN